MTLSNLLSATTIRSAGQTVSDLSFTLSNPAGALGTPSASGQLANIGSGGSVTNVSGSPTRWIEAGHISVTGNTVLLEALGGGQPDQLILPSGTSFPNSNASINHGQFNPFVIGPLTFTLPLSGVTPTTTVSLATFSFGTGPDTLPYRPRSHRRCWPAGCSWRAVAFSAGGGGDRKSPEHQSNLYTSFAG